MPAVRPTPVLNTPALGISRRDPVVHRLALAWRDLTGGRARGQDLCRRTLLACSGGGDSAGLAIGLAAAVSKPRGIFVVAHVVHDLRPREEALADRNVAAALAESLGLPFAEASISVRELAGNAEANARRLRYRALAELAGTHRCHFIATAHHAQDQFETLLMALLRGSGTRGLRGIARSRAMGGGSGGRIRLIRPALEVETADLRRLCCDGGIEWAEDATNRDVGRLRAALRHQIIPQLEALRPGAARRAARTAQHLRAAEGLIVRRSRDVLNSGREQHGVGFEWPRELLRSEPPIVLGAVLRDAAAEMTERRGLDRLGSRTLAPIIRALRDLTTDPRTFVVADLTLTIDARRARLTSTER